VETDIDIGVVLWKWNQSQLQLCLLIRMCQLPAQVIL